MDFAANRAAFREVVKTTMQIHRLNLTKEKLATMPATERSLLLLLGHASNEINVFSKLIMMARKGNAPTQLVDHVEAGQVFIVLRVLIGKLHEAWELFKKRVQADEQIRTKYLSQLEPKGKEALQELNKHFATRSPLTQIRNKLSFHYVDSEGLAEANFQRLPVTEPWKFYLSKTVGNTFYFASELVISLSAISLATARHDRDSSADFSREARAFSDLCQTVVTVSRQITELFGQLIAELVTASIPDAEIRHEEIPKGPKISTFCLPYFFDECDTSLANE